MGRDRGPKRIYTEEFKQKAVKMVMPPNNRSVEEAAHAIGMPYSTLHSWRRQALFTLDKGGALDKLERVKEAERDLEVTARKRVQKAEHEREIVNLTVAGYAWVKPALIVNMVVTIILIVERLV